MSGGAGQFGFLDLRSETQLRPRSPSSSPTHGRRGENRIGCLSEVSKVTSEGRERERGPAGGQGGEVTAYTVSPGLSSLLSSPSPMPQLGDKKGHI